ncbi:UNVERIFIED_CONTAM: hypothetical protein FKN15_023279 [Acipenser sinensis]
MLTVITGGTDGIGRAYAFEGSGTREKILNRILVSRSEIDLLDIKAEYQKKYGKTLYQAILLAKRGMNIVLISRTLEKLNKVAKEIDVQDHFATYGKEVFVDRFSRGLQAEYGYKGVIIQSVAPYGVSTPMTRNQKANMSVAPYGVSTPMTRNQKANMVNRTAEDFVNESLDRVLVGDHIHGCFAHEILVNI